MIKKKLVWGFDLGGTQMRCALVEDTIVKSRIFRCSTQRNRPAKDIVNDILKLIRSAEQETGVKNCPLGIGVPTSVTDGCLDPCKNLPTMPNYPLAQKLSEQLERPIILENDAACFALGEYSRIIDKDGKILLTFTLGTSVGLGIVINGNIFKGAWGQAGEIWRSPASIIDKPENNSIIDRYLSGQSLEKLYEKISGKAISGKELHQEAELHNPYALQCFNEYGTYLAQLLCQVVNILDPHIIIFGGSVSTDFDFFSPAFLQFPLLKKIHIRKTEIGDAAPLLGSAYLFN
ncbi:ROK family protein [Treponema sp. HNW]|uniref:ROK family protein n=1 Tax=Treponema sp. HNW TaxID=3116654 RepID=UPI003D0BC849